MKLTTLSRLNLVLALILPCSVMAQTSQNLPMTGHKGHHPGMPLAQPPKHMMRRPAPQPPQPPKFANFPTPEELARMTPPEPMTEDKIRQRFAKRKQMIEEANELDRKAAEKYAQDFARFQKHQSEQLAKIMAKAEKRRESLLQNLQRREEAALKNFRQRNQKAQTIEPKQY